MAANEHGLDQGQPKEVFLVRAKGPTPEHTHSHIFLYYQICNVKGKGHPFINNRTSCTIAHIYTLCIDIVSIREMFTN